MATILRADDLAVVGSNGGGWAAPLGTAQPADPNTSPPGPWLALGAISDDGLVIGFDEDQEQFKPWGLTSPFRTVITNSVRTFQITAWETSRPIVKSLMYRQDVDDLVPDGSGITRFSEPAEASPDRRSFIFDVYDGTVIHRFYIPEGEITDRGEVTYAQGEMAGYEWTISTYPDASNQLVYHGYIVPEVGDFAS